MLGLPVPPGEAATGDLGDLPLVFFFTGPTNMICYTMHM